MTQWVNFTTSVQDGKVYTFSNVRVLKESQLSWVRADVGHILYNCTMSEIPELAQPTAIPHELPYYFATTEAKIPYWHYWCHSVKKILLMFRVQQEKELMDLVPPTSWSVMTAALSRKRTNAKKSAMLKPKCHEMSQFAITFLYEEIKKKNLTFHFIKSHSTRQSSQKLLDSSEMSIVKTNLN